MEGRQEHSSNLKQIKKLNLLTFSKAHLSLGRLYVLHNEAEILKSLMPAQLPLCWNFNGLPPHVGVRFLLVALARV